MRFRARVYRSTLVARHSIVGDETNPSRSVVVIATDDTKRANQNLSYTHDVKPLSTSPGSAFPVVAPVMFRTTFVSTDGPVSSVYPLNVAE